jgi:peptide/nickel transport system substrate-binding protein
VVFEVAPLENGAMIQRMLACDFDAIYMRVLMDLEPAANLDFWLSSGSGHVWNREQKRPATPWEAQIDELMTQQAASLEQEARKSIFNRVQLLMAENLPMLTFAAPRMYSAHSARLRGVVPSVLRPPILWNADSLSVADAPAAR